MKIVSAIDTAQLSYSHEHGASVPRQICMHVLGEARTDGRVMREAKALVEAGFAVSIVDIESDCTRPVTEVVDGVCLKHIMMSDWFVPTRFKPWFLVKMARMFVQSMISVLQTPADSYHAHEEMALPACYLAARLRRKPVVFDAHELPLSEQHITRWRRLCTLSSHLLKRMVPHCAGVITVSPPIAQEIRQRFGASTVQLLRNVPPYQQVAKSDRLRQHLGLSPDTRIALYQGNLQPDRELDRLVYAAASLEQNTVIVMMGKGPEETLKQLKTLIEREGVADRVRLLPPVPYAELLEWTASADVGLIIYAPQHSKNIQMCLPNKLFEYLMAGLPVLVSALDVVAEVVKTYDVGVVAPSLSPTDIGQAINTVLQDASALNRMSHNALAAAQSEFCWEKEHRQLIKLYQHIFNRVGRGSEGKRI